MHHSVHPHLCGAYVVGMDAPPVVGGSSPPTWGIRLDSSTAFLKCGSSPHTWGIHRVRGQERAERRFIPTYVGHTRPRSRYHPHPPVHPHIRGAYAFASLRFLTIFGSSPHTWGILVTVPGALLHRRFIPTYVGHTSTVCRWASETPVHPHIRGAYSIQEIRAQLSLGSSPHTWGILGRRIRDMCSPRFIPTYVGHTPRRSLHPQTYTVHPHIRGAYTGPP